MNIVNLKIVALGLLLIFSSKEVLATSLTEVLEEALQTSVQLTAARNKLESESEGIQKLKSNKKPSVSANFSGDRSWNLKNDDEADNIAANITARYMLYDGNQTTHQIKAETFRIKALEVEFKGLKQDVIYEAVIAYLNVLKNSRLAELSKKNVSVLTQQLDAIISRYQLGELTQTDVAQAKAALEAATSILVAREGALYLANYSFETAVGIKPINLDANVRLPSLPKNENEAKEFAAKFNLDLMASALREKRAQALLKAAKSKNFPTVNFSTSLAGGEGDSQQEFSTFSFSLSGTLPLYSGGSRYSDERKALSELELSMVNAEIKRLQVQQAVVTAWSDYQVSSAIITARTREVEATELAYQGTVEETRLGARTVLDVLTAEQNLMDAQTNLETAKSDRLAAGYRVLLETGTLTASILGLVE